MAAHVTKLFLQNALQSAQQPPASKQSAKGRNPKSAQPSAPQKAKLAAKKVRAPATRTKQPPKGKKSEHFLDVAKKELESADRTRENLNKLQVRASKKSQRLMAKVRIWTIWVVVWCMYVRGWDVLTHSNRIIGRVGIAAGARTAEEGASLT